MSDPDRMKKLREVLGLVVNVMGRATGYSGPCFDHNDPFFNQTVVIPNSCAGTRLRATSSNMAARAGSMADCSQNKSIGIGIGLWPE